MGINTYKNKIKHPLLFQKNKTHKTFNLNSKILIKKLKRRKSTSRFTAKMGQCLPIMSCHTVLDWNHK
jgi:hypothetical protein